ncbi:MAG TPA: hypothetical protein EYH03_07475 [Chromatiales bacterium]|nr:hypothetical protein [Chromatiales bacterium]
MVALYTDFGVSSPYVGQMKAVIARGIEGVECIDLLHEAPRFDPRSSAYLLAALVRYMPRGVVYLCVVDPGVGGERCALWVKTEQGHFIGPDNGLMSQVIRDAQEAQIRALDWPEEGMSASFHGRDLFAPAAVRLLRGEILKGQDLAPGEVVGADWPVELARVVYIDPFGNFFTGLSARAMRKDTVIQVVGEHITYARTFCEVPAGAGFWYENSCGLVEVAVNQGSAQARFGLQVGDPVGVLVRGTRRY